jgi:hypothetical protein
MPLRLINSYWFELIHGIVYLRVTTRIVYYYLLMSIYLFIHILLITAHRLCSHHGFIKFTITIHIWYWSIRITSINSCCSYLKFRYLFLYIIIKYNLFKRQWNSEEVGGAGKMEASEKGAGCRIVWRYNNNNNNKHAYAGHAYTAEDYPFNMAEGYVVFTTYVVDVDTSRHTLLKGAPTALVCCC